MSSPAASFRVLPDSWQKGEYRVVLVIIAACVTVSPWVAPHGSPLLYAHTPRGVIAKVIVP